MWHEVWKLHFEAVAAERMDELRIKVVPHVRLNLTMEFIVPENVIDAFQTNGVVLQYASTTIIIFYLKLHI
jgi:hypothetical protein